MVHHQDVAVEMSSHLQAAQQEIQKLRDWLGTLMRPLEGTKGW
jgi:hypothetical protein